MEETGGILDITVETAAIDGKECSLYSDLPAGDYLRVIVSDNGPGIPSDIIERVFDPYFTTKAFGEGAGMGLTVVHGIVKNHSGTITVDSRPGEGAAFTLLFPLIDRKSEVETDTRDG
jgi:signal transduction histidine kinase